MEWDDAVLRSAVARACRTGSGGASGGASAPAGGASAPAAPAPSTSSLHPDLEHQMDAVHHLFGQWTKEAAAKRAAALSAQPFASPQAFSSALVVFNQRGERRSRAGRTLQDWYFAPRRCSTRLEAAPCHRCHVAIRRREVFYIDAAKPWRLADEMCQVCMTYVVRSHLGEDDAAILAEAERLLDWRPSVDVWRTFCARRRAFPSAVFLRERNLPAPPGVQQVWCVPSATDGGGARLFVGAIMAGCAAPPSARERGALAELAAALGPYLLVLALSKAGDMAALLQLRAADCVGVGEEEAMQDLPGPAGAAPGHGAAAAAAARDVSMAEAQLNAAAAAALDRASKLERPSAGPVPVDEAPASDASAAQQGQREQAQQAGPPGGKLSGARVFFQQAGAGSAEPDAAPLKRAGAPDRPRLLPPRPDQCRVDLLSALLYLALAAVLWAVGLLLPAGGPAPLAAPFADANSSHPESASRPPSSRAGLHLSTAHLFAAATLLAVPLALMAAARGRWYASARESLLAALMLGQAWLCRSAVLPAFLARLAAQEQLQHAGWPAARGGLSALASLLNLASFECLCLSPLTLQAACLAMMLSALPCVCSPGALAASPFCANDGAAAPTLPPRAAAHVAAALVVVGGLLPAAVLRVRESRGGARAALAAPCS
eukprot:scaffold14.g1017.t1